MNQRELDRIRFATRHYAELQGLTYGVHDGLTYLAAALAFTSVDMKRNELLGMLVLFASLAASNLLVRRLVALYRSSLGEVVPYRSRASRWPFRLVWYPGLVLLFVVPPSLMSMANYVLLGLGLISVLKWFQSGARRIQLYRLAMGCALLLLGVPSPVLRLLAFRNVGTSLILGGLADILCGLLDHRQLLRVMGGLRQAPADEEAAPLQALAQR